MVALVEGDVRFEAGARAFKGATLRVRLEKVSELDAPAVTVAECVKPDVAFDPGRANALGFALAGGELDARERYVVRAHVDVDGDGKVSRGDYVSAQSYPVLAAGYPQKVSILVKVVK